MQKPILPVFKIYEEQYGIIVSPFYVCTGEPGKTRCDEVTYEKTLIKNVQRDAFIQGEAYLAWYPEVFKNKIGSHNLYLFTLSATHLTKTVNFGEYGGDCLEYYKYELNPVPEGNALFVSPFQIELTRERNLEVEQAHRRQTRTDCYDCRSEYEPIVSLARLTGVPDLFITYTDTFKTDDQYLYPSRSIVIMLPNGKIATIWQETVDLFGCACL